MLGAAKCHDSDGITTVSLAIQDLLPEIKEGETVSLSLSYILGSSCFHFLVNKTGP